MDIIYEISRDPDLLDQYYKLRQRCYREELGLDGFDGSQEARDINARILIAHSNGTCIGGARIASAGDLVQALPRRQGPLYQYCVWERFVLSPEIRTVKLARDFCSHLIDSSLDLGYRVALVLSSLRNARFYRACHSALGMDFEITRRLSGQHWGEFDGLEHYLSISQLNSGEQAMWMAA